MKKHYDEVINFRDFISDDYKKSDKKRSDIATLSLAIPALFISPSSLFSPPPMIVTGYLLVLGFGGLAISGVALEKYFAQKGDSSTASAISTILNFLLPAICYGALIYFVVNNPLLRW